MDGNGNLSESNELVNVPITDLAPVQSGQTYKFRLIFTEFYGRFSVFSVADVPAEITVGELRVKSIESHDGISTDNDLLQTYTYNNGLLFA
ncbi:MAG: hypothetical protein AAGI23_13920 [Bacteroidota bacterium]